MDLRTVTSSPASPFRSYSAMMIPELRRHALGGGLELLLLEFLLQEPFGGELLNLGAGADQTERQDGEQRTEQGQVSDFHEH